MRRIAIGDIHGCAKALRGLVDAIDPQPQDQLVFLGDYIDRGPDSRDVVDQVIALRDRCNVVTLRGNHEIMLMGVVVGGLDDRVWLDNGGQSTVASYGGSTEKIPAEHLSFFQQLVPFYETSTEIFAHANYVCDLAMHAQTDMTLFWTHLPSPLPQPHQSGKRVILGHTPQPDNRILDAGHLVCIDTYCFGGGCLTALDVGSGDVIQTNRHGHLVRPPLISAAHQALKLGKNITEFCRKRFAGKGPSAAPARKLEC
ncbi:MAG: metallophosphoesterase family protein [Rubripirellula sp.]